MAAASQEVPCSEPARAAGPQRDVGADAAGSPELVEASWTSGIDPVSLGPGGRVDFDPLSLFLFGFKGNPQPPSGTLPPPALLEPGDRWIWLPRRSSGLADLAPEDLPKARSCRLWLSVSVCCSFCFVFALLFLYVRNVVFGFSMSDLGCDL